jgi:hypothetical protein
MALMLLRMEVMASSVMVYAGILALGGDPGPRSA